METIIRHRCIIGEGPVWNEFNNKLYHVNGFGANEICSIDLKTKEIVIRKLDFGVSAMAFTKKGEMIMILIKKKELFALQADK